MRMIERARAVCQPFKMLSFLWLASHDVYVVDIEVYTLGIGTRYG